MQNSERISFASKIGAILAAAGSAVGLGNVWRFPYETGNHGGAAFILIYLGCVFLFGLVCISLRITDYDCRIYHRAQSQSQYRRGF